MAGEEVKPRADGDALESLLRPGEIDARVKALEADIERAKKKIRILKSIKKMAESEDDQ